MEESYKPVWDLKPGDLVKGADGNWWRVEGIAVPEHLAHFSNRPKVYNITASSCCCQKQRQFYHYDNLLVEFKI